MCVVSTEIHTPLFCVKSKGHDFLLSWWCLISGSYIWFPWTLEHFKCEINVQYSTCKCKLCERSAQKYTRRQFVWSEKVMPFLLSQRYLIPMSYIWFLWTFRAFYFNMTCLSSKSTRIFSLASLYFYLLGTPLHSINIFCFPAKLDVSGRMSRKLRLIRAIVSRTALPFVLGWKVCLQNSHPSRKFKVIYFGSLTLFGNRVVANVII